MTRFLDAVLSWLFIPAKALGRLAERAERRRREDCGGDPW